MARNIYKLRRLKWGGPEQKLKVLAEDIGRAAQDTSPRRKLAVTIPRLLAGLMIVSAFGIGYTWDGISSASVKAMLPRANCNIKGNISIETGERIFHVPGQKYYHATRISPDHGERRFCSEEEARKAGWRKARQ